MNQAVLINDKQKNILKDLAKEFKKDEY